MAAQDGSDDRAGGSPVGGRRGKIPQTAAQRPGRLQRPRRRTHRMQILFPVFPVVKVVT